MICVTSLIAFVTVQLGKSAQCRGSPEDKNTLDYMSVTLPCVSFCIFFSAPQMHSPTTDKTETKQNNSCPIGIDK